VTWASLTRSPGYRNALLSVLLLGLGALLFLAPQTLTIWRRDSFVSALKTRVKAFALPAGSDFPGAYRATPRRGTLDF
jgi:hypothetical protein